MTHERDDMEAVFTKHREDEQQLERRLLRETRDNRIARIDKGGIDCAEVQVTYWIEHESILDDEVHCGHFIVICHKIEEWDEEVMGEEYSPYASSAALIEEWFEQHPDFSDHWQIDDTYAC